MKFFKTNRPFACLLSCQEVLSVDGLACQPGHSQLRYGVLPLHSLPVCVSDQVLRRQIRFSFNLPSDLLYRVANGGRDRGDQNPPAQAGTARKTAFSTGPEPLISTGYLTGTV